MYIENQDKCVVSLGHGAHASARSPSFSGDQTIQPVWVVIYICASRVPMILIVHEYHGYKYNIAIYHMLLLGVASVCIPISKWFIAQ
jgi:tryptophan-rich sensory protein